MSTFVSTISNTTFQILDYDNTIKRKILRKNITYLSACRRSTKSLDKSNSTSHTLQTTILHFKSHPSPLRKNLESARDRGETLKIEISVSISEEIYLELYPLSLKGGNKRIHEETRRETRKERMCGNTDYQDLKIFSRPPFSTKNKKKAGREKKETASSGTGEQCEQVFGDGEKRGAILRK